MDALDLSFTETIDSTGVPWQIADEARGREGDLRRLIREYVAFWFGPT